MTYHLNLPAAFPALTGTPKQVAWADAIRREAFATLALQQDAVLLLRTQELLDDPRQLASEWIHAYTSRSLPGVFVSFTKVAREAGL
jgi:hypothetical protein